MTKKYKYSVREILIKFFEDGLMKKDVGISMLQEKAEEQWPKTGDGYWHISDWGSIGLSKFNNDSIDQYRLKTNNVFKTRLEAENKLKEVMK